MLYIFFIQSIHTYQIIDSVIITSDGGHPFYYRMIDFAVEKQYTFLSELRQINPTSSPK